jgi:hypothetical protein
MLMEAPPFPPPWVDCPSRAPHLVRRSSHAAAGVSQGTLQLDDAPDVPRVAPGDSLRLVRGGRGWSGAGTGCLFCFQLCSLLIDEPVTLSQLLAKLVDLEGILSL